MFMKKMLIIPVLMFSVACSDSTDTKKDTATTSQQSTESNNAKIAFYINERPVYESRMIQRNIDKVINDEIIYEAALIEKMDLDPEINKQVAGFKKSLILGTIKGKVISDHLKNNVITEEEVKAHYEKNINDYTTLNVLQISSSDKDAIDDLYNKVSNGKSFEETFSAIKNSGVIITKRQLENTKKYNRLFDKMEIGSMSAPNKKNALNYTYRITEVKVKPFKYSKNKIKFHLISISKPKAVKDYAESVKAKHNIKVKMVN